MVVRDANGVELKVGDIVRSPAAPRNDINYLYIVKKLPEWEEDRDIARIEVASCGHSFPGHSATFDPEKVGGRHINRAVSFAKLTEDELEEIKRLAAKGLES